MSTAVKNWFHGGGWISTLLIGALGVGIVYIVNQNNSTLAASYVPRREFDEKASEIRDIRSTLLRLELLSAENNALLKQHLQKHQ
jgi:hypothetical protein